MKVLSEELCAIMTVTFLSFTISLQTCYNDLPCRCHALQLMAFLEHLLIDDLLFACVHIKWAKWNCMKQNICWPTVPRMHAYTPWCRLGLQSLQSVRPPKPRFRGQVTLKEKWLSLPHQLKGVDQDSQSIVFATDTAPTKAQHVS